MEACHSFTLTAFEKEQTSHTGMDSNWLLKIIQKLDSDQLNLLHEHRIHMTNSYYCVAAHSQADCCYAIPVKPHSFVTEVRAIS